jgi:hypothetical protein
VSEPLTTRVDTPIAPRDATFWAPAVTRLDMIQAQNVTGRRLTGPDQGFGRLWQITYRADIGAVASPVDVVERWKREFPHYWPKTGRFLGSGGALAPGDVAAISVGAGGVRLATGVMVLYADEESFTFMTPEGHMFAGWITFGATRDPARATTVATIDILVRTNDPLYEAGMRLIRFGEDRFWTGTLRNLGAAHGVPVDVEITALVLDRKRIWRNWRNVWHNAGIRSVLALAAAPVRRLRRRHAAA